MIFTRFMSKVPIETQRRDRAARVAVASSADISAITAAIGVLENAAGAIEDHQNRAYTLIQSAILHLVLQLRDARLWRDGGL